MSLCLSDSKSTIWLTKNAQRDEFLNKTAALREVMPWPNNSKTCVLAGPLPLRESSGRISDPASNHSYKTVDFVWNVMAHTQKPDFVLRRNGLVHLNRRGRQFSRLLAAEVCASAVVMVVMLDTPCSEVVWRVLSTHPIRQFPLHFPTRASPCAIAFQLDFTVDRSANWMGVWNWLLVPADTWESTCLQEYVLVCCCLVNFCSSEQIVGWKKCRMENSHQSKRLIRDKWLSDSGRIWKLLSWYEFAEGHSLLVDSYCNTVPCICQHVWLQM